MYRDICVPIDNSEWSSRAIDFAVALGQAFGARLTGVHVYAARLHERRFHHMEPALPERYRDERLLERQRAVHASLIGAGLRLISDSYLDAMAPRVEAAGLAFARKALDGTHWRVLVEDARASGYDLLVLGALGMGGAKESQLGSVALRVLRTVRTDTLVVRSGPTAEPGAPIVCCLDGSPASFAGLRVGLALAKALGRPLQALAVYDPYLHYAMFKAIAGVLSAEAARRFHFREQAELHEEIVDRGLARIYQAHLDAARDLAARAGLDLSVTLLAGRCVEKVLAYAREEPAWLVIAGRTGLHADDGAELGSNAETLARQLPCNVLLAAGRPEPPAGPATAPARPS